MITARLPGNWLIHNYDIIVILSGIAIIPLAGPVDEYYVLKYSSTASGAGLAVYAIAPMIIMIGLVVRIYRSYIGRK